MTVRRSKLDRANRVQRSAVEIEQKTIPPAQSRKTLEKVRPSQYDSGGSLACQIKEDLDSMTGAKTVKGNLYEEGNYWVVRARVYDPSTGKTKHRSKSTGCKVSDHTKRKAEQLMKSIVAQWEKDANAAPIVSDPLFSEYIEKWLEKTQRKTKANTYKSYVDYARVHILPALGHLRIRKMQFRHLQEYYDQKLSVLSVNSLRKHHVVIHGAVLMAYRDGVVTEVFSNYIELPEAKKYEGKAYNETQVKRLLDCVEQEGEPIRSAIILAVVYGLRRSEICGLRWQDVDFDNGELTVKNTVTQNGALRIEAEETKTKSSKRTIWLVDSTIPYLKELKETQERSGLKLDKVCVWPEGKMVRPDYITSRTRKIMKRCGIEVIRLHDLRHTAATLLAKEAKPKQVQGFLGHGDIKTTMNIYTHLLDEDRKETSNIMDSILKKAVFCSEKCSE